jgi:hypothetical protein
MSACSSRSEGETKRAKTTTGVVTRVMSKKTATQTRLEEIACKQEEDARRLDLKERPIPTHHGKGSVAFWKAVNRNWLSLARGNAKEVDVPFLREKILKYNVLVDRLTEVEAMVNSSLDGEALDVSQVAPVVVLSSEQQSIFDRLPEAMRDYVSDLRESSELLKSRIRHSELLKSRIQLSESWKSRIQLRESFEAIFCEIRLILCETQLAVGNIGNILGTLSGFCQAESTREDSTSRISGSSSISEDDEASHLPALIRPYSHVSYLTDSHLDFDDSSHLCRDMLLKPTADDDMVSLSETLSDIFGKSIFLRKSKKKKKLAKYKEKITTAKELLKNALILTNMATNCQKVAGEQKMHMPGPTCQEVEIQEIFQVILEAICSIRTKAGNEDRANTAHSTSPPASPKKTTVSTEKVVQATETRKKRRVDFTVWKRGRHISVMRDDCMQMPMEIKAGQGSRKNVLEMVREARLQTIGHLARAVALGFNFQSKGVDTHATGVAASLFYVEVSQLKLKIWALNQRP